MCQNAASIIVSNKDGEEVEELDQNTKAFAKWRRSLAPRYPNQRLAFAIESSDGVVIVEGQSALNALKISARTAAELVTKVSLKSGREGGDAWKCA